MRKQILLCVETNRKADTDYVYISEVIRSFYKEDRGISYKPIYMGSKSKYKDRNTVREIKHMRDGFPGETKVIYFLDCDRMDIDVSQKREYDDIKTYCDREKYDFVFFCRDIEDVFLGRQIQGSEKVKAAAAFRKNKTIGNINEKSLSSGIPKPKHSNILIILDKYFERASKNC